MLWTSTNSFQFSNQVYKGQRKGVQNLTNVHTPMMEYEPAPSSGNVKIRTRRFMPRKVLNRAFLNQKRGSEGHLPLKLCLRGCVFLGILSKVGYVSRNWKKSTDRDWIFPNFFCRVAFLSPHIKHVLCWWLQEYIFQWVLLLFIMGH